MWITRRSGPEEQLNGDLGHDAFPPEREKIVSLERLRGFAALFVLAHHFHSQLFPTNPWILTPLRFGQEAVMLFFVISGFVIHYSVIKQSNFAARRYFLNRFVRLYPIFTVALIISYLCQAIIARDWPTVDWNMLAGNLTMLQDRLRPGTIAQPFAGNAPLWSLSYEWWFYLLYPIMLRVSEEKRAFAVSALSIAAVVGMVLVPSQPLRFLAYFVIWWTGVELCRVIVLKRSGRGLGICIGTLILVTLGFGAFLTLPVDTPISGESGMGGFPILEMRHFGSAVVATGVIWLMAKGRLAWLNWAATPFLLLAPISYAIYVIHYPILGAAFSFGEVPIVATLLALSVTFIVAHVLERELQPRFATWIKGDRKVPAATPQAPLRP